MERIDKNTDAAVDIRRVLSIDVGGSRGSKKKKKKKERGGPRGSRSTSLVFPGMDPPATGSERINNKNWLLDRKKITNK